MKCPFCGGTESRVKDSRDVGDAIHRRRECEQCKGRFSTYERVEKSVLMVIKRDQRREAFDRQNLVALRDDGGKFVALHDQIVAVIEPIALDLILPLDRLAGFAVDELALDSVAGLAVDDVEG